MSPGHSLAEFSGMRQNFYLMPSNQEVYDNLDWEKRNEVTSD